MTTPIHRTSYDEVPYESRPYPQTHPNRLATVGILFGLRPAHPTRARVLEIGCASGGNLIPLALSLPRGEFVGIDSSSVEIEEGKQTIRAIELGNIELHHLDVMQADMSLGQFDYIICHGVYSWVRNDVQDKILQICHQNLSPNGVAYVSYNTYPGWHMRGMVRDMVKYHARSFIEPRMKVRQARNLLDFLAKSVAGEQSPYSTLLQRELESLRHSTDSYLFHEHLEHVNEPIYFHEFVERAKVHGLKYLGEADLKVMVSSNYPPEIENVLQMLSEDNIHLEQYMDFLRNRMFRQTLLCHEHLDVNYQLRSELMKPLSVASSAQPTTDEVLALGQRMKFQARDGLTLVTEEPLVKAAMMNLAEAWPQSVPFWQLVEMARSRLAREEERSETVEMDAVTLGQSLLSFYTSASSTLIELSVHPYQFVTKISERPQASRLARRQATKGGEVTNLRHEPVLLGQFERKIVMNLDGTNDRQLLIGILIDLVRAGELSIERDGCQVTEPALVLELITKALEQQLVRIAQCALLVA